MMKPIFILLLLLFAQAPKTEPVPKTTSELALPAQVEIRGDDFKMLKLAEMRARLAASEAETMTARIQAVALQLEKAQAQLKEMQQRAASEQGKYQTKLIELTKIPLDKLAEYQSDEKDDKLIFKRKPQ